MKFRLPNKFSQTSAFIVRKCGYFHITDHTTGKHSYVRKLTPHHYPRFHLYITESPGEILFDLHLDQSRSRYESQTAHNAEYESEEVKTELTRIYQIVADFQSRDQEA